MIIGFCEIFIYIRIRIRQLLQEHLGDKSKKARSHSIDNYQTDLEILLFDEFVSLSVDLNHSNILQNYPRQSHFDKLLRFSIEKIVEKKGITLRWISCKIIELIVVRDSMNMKIIELQLTDR